MRFTKQLKCAVVLAIVAALPSCDVLSSAGGGCKEMLDVKKPADLTSDNHTIWEATTWVLGVGKVFKDCVLVEGVIVRSDDPRPILEIVAERRREGAKSRDIYGRQVGHATEGDNTSDNNGTLNNKDTAGVIKNNSLGGTTGGDTGGTTGGDTGGTTGGDTGGTTGGGTTGGGTTGGGTTGGDTGGTTGGSTNNSESESASDDDLGLGGEFPPLPGT